MPPSSVKESPPRRVQLRPPARLLNSRISTVYPALRNSSAAVMPASPAPRMSTEAPLGSPLSLIGPLYPESEANPRLVIAWYSAALPEIAPIRDSRSRRLTVTGSLCIVAHCSILSGAPDRRHDYIGLAAK